MTLPDTDVVSNGVSDALAHKEGERVALVLLNGLLVENREGDHAELLECNGEVDTLPDCVGVPWRLGDALALQELAGEAEKSDALALRELAGEADERDALALHELAGEADKRDALALRELAGVAETHREFVS